jgi:hypothetical protein
MDTGHLNIGTLKVNTEFLNMQFSKISCHFILIRTEQIQILHVKWVPFHYSTKCPQTANEGLQMWEVGE